MFDKDKHRSIMLRILKDIYGSNIGKYLGFKGGTMAYLFYELPRMSVDLDFDLLDSDKETEVFEELKEVLAKHGKILESVVKKNTLFFLVDYGYSQRKLKVEVSRRKTETEFAVRNYMGISMLVMNRAAMVACKLVALVERNKFASRDVFDINYFLKNGYDIDKELVELRTGKKFAKVVEAAVSRISKMNENEVMFGLGDLLDEKTKVYVRQKLKEDVKLELKMLVAKR